MSNTLQQPQDAAEQSEVDYGDHLIWRLVGSTITSFGANDNGEIFISTKKGDVSCELIVGTDERGDIALFEVAKP
jgi:hypothetical protein